MKHNDVKKFLDLIGNDIPFAIYFSKTMTQSDENENYISDFFEVADHCELLESALLVIEESDTGKYYYLFDLDIITQMKTNY